MKRCVHVLAWVVLATVLVRADSEPVRVSSHLVVAVNATAAHVGSEVMASGGNAVDAAVATAFALAVTHPSAGNIGGGGFLLFRPASGEPEAYDFRETAPAGASASMWLKNGTYSRELHHDSPWAVGVPGTVAGLHLAWKEHGRLPWKQLVRPAIRLARDGFTVTHGLAASLESVLPRMQAYPASVAQFSKHGVPYQAGDVLRQPDLAATLDRIAERGPEGFYAGETARLIEGEMQRLGGLISRQDLASYQPRKRTPLRGQYRGHEIVTMPPVSSGGVALLQMLNILEGFNLRANGYGSAANVHLMIETMRRAYADRARYIGDPDFVRDIPVDRLTSKPYADALRRTISLTHASRSSSSSFEWAPESAETTHLSVVDRERNAVSLTYTLEAGYGSKIVVSGAGFLLNNEMGDFNAGPDLTTADGLIGTPPNLAAPGKRMVSSMTPTIVARDGRLIMVTGSPGGRTIINTVLQTILNAIDHRMNAQEAVDAARLHHQWLPDRTVYERHGFSPDTLAILGRMGHTLVQTNGIGAAEVIIVDHDRGLLEGGWDRRAPDGGAVGR